jgi:hypothetical protein
MSKIVLAALKPIGVVLAENPTLRPVSCTPETVLAYENGNYHINSTMLKKFGDGIIYQFRSIDMGGRSYTHRMVNCPDDQYSYHESWFIKFDEERKNKKVKFDPKELVL